MRILVGCLFAAISWLPASAWAQVDITLDLDRVMVVPIQAQTSQLVADASRLDMVLQDKIGQGYVLVDIGTVPYFEQQGYDARTYVDACPPGQYAGCALVVAQRVEGVDYVIGGVLEPVDGLASGESQLTIHVIDIAGSREVMAFGVVVGAGKDGEVLQGVAGVFDNVVGGMVDEVDVRGDVEDPEAIAAFEERRQKLIAASLAKLEDQLGEVIREQITVGRLEAPKLTKKDLEQYQDRDDRPPWEQLGMSQAQFIRFENSGVTLQDWRYRMRGRLAQVLVRASVGGGPGVWGTHHEGRWLVEFNENNAQFETVAIRQYQEGRRISTLGVQLELGVGVLPWLEVSGVWGLRTITYSWRFKQDNASDPINIEGDLLSQSAPTNEFGGRILVAPLPTYQIRPTAHLGYFIWEGVAVEPDQEPLVPLEGTRASYFQIGPGVEMSAGRNVNLFVRGHANVLTSSFFFQQRSEGQIERLQNFPEPLQTWGNGFDVQGGVQVRIGLLPPPSESAGMSSYGEEEPDL